MDLDTIYPRCGLKEIPFGSSRTDLYRKLGKPDFEETNEWGDVNIEYRSLGLDFTLWKDDAFRLGVVGTSRRTALIAGFQFIGMREELVRTCLEAQLGSKISDEGACVHEDGEIQSWLDASDLEATIWFRDSMCYRFDAFCGWVDDDTPAWPTEPTSHV